MIMSVIDHASLHGFQELYKEAAHEAETTSDEVGMIVIA
jgi:hypothetical protein